METNNQGPKGLQKAVRKGSTDPKNNIPQEIKTLLKISHELQEPVDYAAVKRLINTHYT